MAITMKGCCTVKPAESTPMTKLSLSESDQLNAITHAPTVYFYRPTSDYPLSSAVETLKTSLSQALVHFYPLAGRLHWIHDGHRLELECNSMGAEIYEAESDEVIDDYGDFRPTPELRKLIPFVDYNMPIHEQPLILVQLTKFRCGGMCLGVAISHILGDGIAALHFISEWARISRGLPLGLVPFLDRTTPWRVKDDDQQGPAHVLPKFDHPEFNPLPLLIGKSDNMEERVKESDVVTLTLNKTDVEKIKMHANDGDYYKYNNSTRPYSRYEAVTGHIWKCACKAHKLDNQQLTTIRIAVDCRNRVDPLLPKGYFGNAVYLTLAISRVGELMEKPLSYASSRIREATQK